MPTPMRSRVLAPSATSPAARGARPATIVGSTRPLTGATPSAVTVTPSTLTRLITVSENALTPVDDLMASPTSLCSAPAAAAVVAAVSTRTSHDQPYSRGVDTRWSRLEPRRPVRRRRSRPRAQHRRWSCAPVPRSDHDRVRAPCGRRCRPPPVPRRRRATPRGATVAPVRWSPARSREARVYHHAGSATSTSTATSTPRNPSPSTDTVEGQAGIGLDACARDADRRQRRRGDGDDDGEHRRGDGDDRTPQHGRHHELHPPEPEGAERRVVDRVEEGLTGDGLADEQQPGEGDDHCEDGERTDRRVHCALRPSPRSPAGSGTRSRPRAGVPAPRAGRRGDRRHHAAAAPPPRRSRHRHVGTAAGTPARRSTPAVRTLRRPRATRVCHRCR